METAQPMFEVTTRYTYYELRRYDSFMLNKCRHYYLRLIVFMAVFAALGVIAILCGAQMIGFCIVGGTVLGTAMGITVTAVRRPKQIAKTPLLDKQVTVRFYSDHLEDDNDYSHSRFEYSMITRVCETEKDFYIMISGAGGIIIAKPNCSNELMEYIRGLDPKKKK